MRNLVVESRSTKIALPSKYFRNRCRIEIMHWNIRFPRLGMHALCYLDRVSLRVILAGMVIGGDAFVIIR